MAAGSFLNSIIDYGVIFRCIYKNTANGINFGGIRISPNNPKHVIEVMGHTAG